MGSFLRPRLLLKPGGGSWRPFWAQGHLFFESLTFGLLGPPLLGLGPLWGAVYAPGPFVGALDGALLAGLPCLVQDTIREVVEL